MITPSVEEYPKSADVTLESALEYVPASLRCLLQHMLVGKDTRKQEASVGHIIVQGVRPRAACKTIVHALVMSRVDYGNALLFGLPEMQLHKLQMIQNSAARLVTGTHGRDHITPVLFKLHWLPVRYRIEFKLLVLVYQAVHHLGPAYLTSLVTPYAPTRSLRSAAHRSLTIPRYNLERYGRRAFSVAGPSLWNNLPVTIREAGTLTTFKSTLKTHLFRIAFKALC